MTHRLGSEKDRNAVYDLYMDETGNPYLTYDHMEAKDFIPIYDEVLKTGTLYVTEDNEEIIATYRLIPKSNRQAHIIYLGGFTIKKTLQGKGLGKQILEHIKKTVLPNGKTRIELTVDVNNSGAIALYTKTGFVTEGRIKNSYKRGDTNEYYDELLMAVILD
ncbi:MAG: GNAT family N-acetyltransferase [Chitinophagaceae bacterium]